MSTPGRHRVRDAEASPHPTSALALTFLALIGLAGPAWVLRDQAADLFTTGNPAPVSVPDTSGPGR